MKTLLQDLKYGARMMWKSPGFTAIAVIALALGIGANTAIFSVVNTLILRPLPYRDSDRLVTVWEFNRPRNRHQNVINPGNFMDWRDQNSVFEAMAAFIDTRTNLTGKDEPVELPAQVATTNLFQVLGVEPIKGRGFTEEDATSDANPVIISYNLWQTRFGSDSKIIGQRVTLSGKGSTIIGVMPAGFQWFIKKGSLTGKAPELWMPVKFTEAERGRKGRAWSAVARLKPNVTIEQAQTEMSTIGSRLEQQYAQFNTGWGVEVVPLREQFVGELRPALWILLGAVGFVLLIACANVANLLLARAASRHREMAIRIAMGANRMRVVRQLLTESILLSALGGALGLLLAWWGIEVLMAFSPRDLLTLDKIGINVTVLLFTLGVSFLTGVIFGIVPAIEATRLNTSEMLKEGSKSIGGSPRARRLTSAFVVAQIALSLVLLVGAGLMLKSLMRLQSVNPGFDSDNLLTMRVILPGSKYKEDPQVVGFFKQAVERIEALPGVKSAGAVSFLPFTGLAAATRYKIEGKPEPPPGQSPGGDVRVVDNNYFRTMGIPLRSGRNFNAQEQAEARHVVIINETLAKQYFPNEDPIGKRITISMMEEPVPSEIIGVVGDVKHMSLDGEVKPMTYWPHPELVYNSMTIVVKTSGDPLQLAAAVQREIQAIDPNQPVSDVRTMEQWLSESVARARFNTLLLGLFSALALLLAAVGIFGVISYSVTQRTHEIGIRMALGASARDVLKMVVGQGMLMALGGVALGLGASFLLTRVMSSLLFEVSATDPLTFIFISLLLMVVTLLACYIPARRATRVDPMTALRYE
ncbi:MAG TPA: ABC transporter permease [Pyrinomonadaceae bacterium]|nr:ABC transporter permease [Pyrinomonadaceae bacterium]